MMATPDTGCTKTIISRTIADKAGLEWSKETKTILRVANGERMAVQGMAILSVTANGVRAEIEAIISPDIKELMLVSCQDLMSLRTLPQGFPNVTVHECRITQDYKEMLIKEFPNTLSDELNPEPMKTEKPIVVQNVSKY